jgi:hypothetical protein
MIKKDGKYNYIFKNIKTRSIAQTGFFNLFFSYVAIVILIFHPSHLLPLLL